MAEEIDELKKHKEELDKIYEQLNAKRQTLQDIKKKEKNTLLDLTTLRSRMNQQKEKLTYTQYQLETLRREISSATGQIHRFEIDVDGAMDNLSKKYRNMYKRNVSTFWEILLNTSELTDMLNDMYYYKRLVEEDKQFITDVRNNVQQLKALRDKVGYRKQQTEVLKDTIVAQTTVIKRMEREKSSLYDELRLKRDQFERDIVELQRNSDQVEELIAKLAKQGKLAARLGTGKFIVPTTGFVSSGFGMRLHPVFKKEYFHSGIDVATPQGTPVKAADDGMVIYSGSWGGYGKTVILDHGAHLTTLYGHLSRLYASTGAFVKKGQIVALSGNTGVSTGPHLHFEVRETGKPVNPQRYLP